MVVLGSRVLNRLMAYDYVQEDPELLVQIGDIWKTLETAWEGTQADRIAALTRFQRLLLTWSEDADVAEEHAVQSYRRKLHLFLDH